MTNASHRKAWLEIAEAYATPRYKRTTTQRDIARSGLCYASSIMSAEIRGLCRLNKTTYRRKTGWWWPTTPPNDQYRALSAMLIAEMGPVEFRRIREEG